MRLIFGLALISGAAHAGVVYDLEEHSVNGGVTPPPELLQFTVQDDKVRVVAFDGTITIVRDQTIYQINSPSRSVEAIKYATLSQLTARYANMGKQFEDALATASPDQRAWLEDMAREMKEEIERISQPMPRKYQITDRSESVDGHECRIWEERENGTKRLELCVASLTTTPGGAEILGGMKSLSQYWHGSPIALAAELGPGPWWTGIETLGGVPILIREFKDDAPIREAQLTAIHVEVPAASLFELPDGYSVHEQVLGDP
jgi:hypothetical protein